MSQTPGEDVGSDEVNRQAEEDAATLFRIGGNLQNLLIRSDPESSKQLRKAAEKIADILHETDDPLDSSYGTEY